MTCNIKIGKKRTYNESLATDINKQSETLDGNNLKRKKLDENGTDGKQGTNTEQENCGSDKENNVN